MVRNQFGTGTSASTMVSGRCELQSGPQMKYRLDSNDEVEWIKMKGGDEPFRFEPPLDLHCPTVHGNRPIFEERFEQWLEMMMDCKCDVNVIDGEIHTPALDFEVVTTIAEDSIREPDVYWEDVRYEFPTVVNGSDAADVPTGSHFTKSGKMGIDPAGDLVSKEDISSGFRGVDVRSDNNDSEDEKSDTDSKSLENKLNEVADDIGEKRVEEMDERAVEYMRENRDTFKAEITNVHLDSLNQSVSFCLDIPTHDEEYYYSCNIRSEDEIGGRVSEVMRFLGVNLRELHMVEGMYLPVAYIGDSGRQWEVFPSKREKSAGLIDKMWSYRFRGEIFFALGLMISAAVVIIPGLQHTLLTLILFVSLCVVGIEGMLPTREDLKP